MKDDCEEDLEQDEQEQEREEREEREDFYDDDSGDDFDAAIRRALEDRYAKRLKAAAQPIVDNAAAKQHEIAELSKPLVLPTAETPTSEVQS